MTISFSEAERQILIAHIELADPIETPNNTHYRFYPKTLDEAAAYFLTIKENWSPAYENLMDHGLLRRAQSGYALTPAGMSAAHQERLDHPPIWYWYREYYTITARSQAYAHFCETLYGRNLCQTDFSDMAQITFMLEQAGLQPGMHALDLGCGNGLFAEYVSDCTGADVAGVDYVPEAIQQALERTATKRDRLSFSLGNFDHLAFPEGSFDRILSIDTLYMPNDLPATLRTLKRFLAPGGRMFIFYSAMSFDPTASRQALLPDHTELGQALEKVNLPYRTWDFTEPAFYLMRRKHQLAEAMRGMFEAEGSLFLYHHLISESDGSEGPFDPETVNMRRYLYEVRISQS